MKERTGSFGRGRLLQASGQVRPASALAGYPTASSNNKAHRTNSRLNTRSPETSNERQHKRDKSSSRERDGRERSAGATGKRRGSFNL